MGLVAVDDGNDARDDETIMPRRAEQMRAIWSNLDLVRA